MIQNEQGHVVRALTVAGSDSGGGAGIQADLKTMHQFQVYGMSVVTALTAQNTLGVQGIYDVTPAFVRQQLESVSSDIGFDAVKTGMLGNGQIIETVASFLRQIRVKHLVVDPVMVSKGGSTLLIDDAVTVLKDHLLPLAKIVTPNLPEAEVLCGYRIRTLDDCHQAARDIALLGPQTVLVKGGHMPAWWAGDKMNLAVDMVYAEGEFTYFATERVDTYKTHGTGCTFSAAITSMLALGVPMLEAIASAKEFIYGAVQGAKTWNVGAGHGPTDHSTPIPATFEPVSSAFYVCRNGRWMKESR